MPAAGPPFTAECAKCGYHFVARQTVYQRVADKRESVVPWPPCPKCGHRHVYEVKA